MCWRNIFLENKTPTTSTNLTTTAHVMRTSQQNVSQSRCVWYTLRTRCGISIFPSPQRAKVVASPQRPATYPNGHLCTARASVHYSIYTFLSNLSRTKNENRSKWTYPPYRSRGQLCLLNILMCVAYSCAAVRLSQGALNIDDPTLVALIESLPEAPAMARLQCQERCSYAEEDSLSQISDSQTVP